MFVCVYVRVTTCEFFSACKVLVYVCFCTAIYECCDLVCMLLGVCFSLCLYLHVLLSSVYFRYVLLYAGNGMVLQ